MRHLLFAALASVCLTGIAVAEEPVYELRIYTCEEGKLDALNERFRNHTMKLFEKHGMKNVAYWIPTEGETSKTTLIYILEHASRDAAKASWEAFRNDPEWKQVAADSQAKHGKILAKAPEAIYMARTDYSPKVSLPQAGKVFELRTYTAAEGKLADMNARFRNHTDALFRKHGMHALGYWQPVDPPQSENVMIYVLAHESREAAAQSWKNFGADPEWQTARAKSEENGPILAKRPDAVFMTLTDYSPKAAAE